VLDNPARAGRAGKHIRCPGSGQAIARRSALLHTRETRVSNSATTKLGEVAYIPVVPDQTHGSTGRPPVTVRSRSRPRTGRRWWWWLSQNLGSIAPPR